MSLGNTILKYRKELGITQESLAQQLEVTNQAVSKWESDQCCPDVMLLPRLADIFDITLDELFERKSPEKTPQVVEELPWPDDGSLRGVLYLGRKLIDHGKGPKCQLSFMECVEGDVYSHFSVSCGDVRGDVDSGTDVHCGSVFGDVDAGVSVVCGDVMGDVDAGVSVKCGSVGGSVDAGVSVTITK